MTAGTVNYDGQITVQAVHSGGDTGAVARQTGSCLSSWSGEIHYVQSPATHLSPSHLVPAAVADIVRMVEAAQSRAAPVQRFADVVAVRPAGPCTVPAAIALLAVG